MRSVVEIAEGVRSGVFSASEVLEESVAQIEEKDERLNAFCHLDLEGAGAAAKAIDDLVAAGGDPGPLAGVPFGVKDLEDCAGMPTTYGSTFFVGGPVRDADMVHVARLRVAGAIPIGKVATGELGLTGDCHSEVFGTTRNPWDLERTPGGSSGGSAAAVSGGMVPFCTGSDGGGSLRAPASFCGLVALKPSHGRVPNASGASENSTFSTAVTTVGDAARCLDIMSGPHNCDRMSLPTSNVCYEQAAESLDISGCRAVWSEDFGYIPVEREVASIAHNAAERLIEAAELFRIEKSLHFTNITPALLCIYSERLTTKLTLDGFLPDRYDEISATVRSAFEAVESTSHEAQYRSREDILRLEREVAEFFGEADFMLSPTTACTAFNAEGPWPRVIDGRDASITGDAPFTPLANYCWNPSISVPAGVTSDGMPVGLMITGPRHRDDLVLRMARIWEQIQPWPRTAPGW